MTCDEDEHIYEKGTTFESQRGRMSVADVTDGLILVLMACAVTAVLKSGLRCANIMDSSGWLLDANGCCHHKIGLCHKKKNIAETYTVFGQLFATYNVVGEKRSQQTPVI